MKNVRDRGAMAWLLVLSFLGAVAVVRAETNGLCSRCAKWVKVSEDGAGLDRNWLGLCGLCKDPKSRCDEAIKELERAIEKARDDVGYFRTMAANTGAYRVAEDDLPWMRELLADAEARLAELQRRLTAIKAECFGTGTDAGPSDGGSAGGAAGRTDPGTAARDLRDQVDRLNRLGKELSDRLRAVEEQMGTGAVEAAGAPIEAEHLDRLERHVKPIDDAARAGAPAASEAKGAAPAVSQEERIRPTLVDVRRDLPKARAAQQLAIWQRSTANAAAYADALVRSVEQVEAARALGNPTRAQRHLERAVSLAAMGQKELRLAVVARNAALSELYRESAAFAKKAKEGGKTVEEALAAWQAEVRKSGLTAEYVAGLQNAGMSEAEIAKRRDWLLSVDPAAAAKAHATFLSVVAPLHIAEARGKGNARPPLPEVDDLWDQVAILLLRSEAEAKPAEGGR